MTHSAVEYRRAGADAQALTIPISQRWYARLGLSLLTLILLTLAYAPYHQFHLAWVGLVPWLLLVRSTQSQKGAFFWSWLTGTSFFIANMWWLANVTVPGMVALMVWLGLYWGVAAMIIRGLGLLTLNTDRLSAPDAVGKPRAWNLHSLACVFGIATAWVAASEYIRGNYPFNGLPWLLLGHTQSPLLPMTQIADAVGAFGVSFWVMLVNAWIAIFLINRLRFRGLIAPLIAVIVLLTAIFMYGQWRLSQDTLTPGPTILVVQPNFPQDNTGQRSASPLDWINFHVDTTRKALDQLRAEGKNVDLVVWSETMLPEMNPEAIRLYAGVDRGEYEDYGAFLVHTRNQVQNIAMEYSAGIIAGGHYFNAKRDRTLPEDDQIVTDTRNSAFFFDRNGLRGERYDKIHLVPFGEYIPFKTYFPPLYRFFLLLSPYDSDYTMTPGKEDALTVFELQRDQRSEVRDQQTTAPSSLTPDPDSAELVANQPLTPFRFVVPICFEDIDAALCAKMFRSRDGRKRADMLVNITNDGWFMANEMPQHLQVASFRSIENRVPTARSVNTGISGFIDSAGRIDWSTIIPAGQSGWSVSQVILDSRVALFTRIGDAFAILCTLITAAIVLSAIVAKSLRKARSN